MLVHADMEISNSQRIQLQSSSDFERSSMSTDGVVVGISGKVVECALIPLQDSYVCSWYRSGKTSINIKWWIRGIQHG